MSSHHAPLIAVREAVARALAEDVGPLGDITASLVPTDATLVASLVPRSSGVLAGRLAAHEAFFQVDPGIAVEWHKDDGDRIEAGQAIARVEGSARSVLTAERTALNFMTRLSGVATLTRRFVDASPIPVRDTRKTTPGLRALEKAAVRAGGGVNHRASLSDGILVKDNHLAGMSIHEAVARARRMWPGRTVEVECDTMEQVVEGEAAGADLFLLDNMTVDEVAAVSARFPDGGILLEVSGGVTLDNVRAYAAAGAHWVAVGALTHSAPALDIGMDLEAG